MDTNSNALNQADENKVPANTKNSSAEGSANLIPFNRGAKVDASYLKSLRNNIDAVRMNLSAEIAELRQRRATYQQQIARIMRICMGVYTIYSTVRALVLMFKKGGRSPQQLIKGVAIQAGLFAAQKLWEHYQTRVAKEEPKQEPMRLLTDQKAAFY